MLKRRKLKLLAKKLNVMDMNLDTKNQLLNGVNQHLNQDGKQKLKKVINLHQRNLKVVIILYK